MNQSRAFAACNPVQRAIRVLCGVLLLLAAALLPHAAWADCGFASGAATTVTFNAGTLILTPSTTPGTVLWTSSTAAPANPPVLACNGNTNGGLVNTIAAQSPVGGDTTLLPTGIPGISYRILHPGTSNPLKIYPDYPTGSATFSVASNLELVYSGPYLPSNNSTLTGQLSQWKIDICNNPVIYNFGGGFYYYVGCNGTVAPRPVETFNINANIVIQVPTCDIDPGSVNKTVILPTVGIPQFTGQGSSPGKTPFSLQLTNCTVGYGVYVTLDTNNPQTGTTGVIAPAGAGYASNIGVQILEGDGATPVTFGSIFKTGTTTASNYAINLYAQYYQTGTPVSAGQVHAVATFTVAYQ